MFTVNVNVLFLRVTRKQKMPPASSPFVPTAAGIAIASYAVKTLLKRI
ncbi:hypothetical protein ACWG42_12140 [Amedibacillus sp. YH-ame10]